MTPEELAAEIERLIVANSAKFAGIITNIQGTIYNKLIGILKGLELDGEGYIKQSAANRTILREAQNTFDDIIANSPYQNAVENHLRLIPKLDAVNGVYFKKISDSFTPNRIFIKELQKQIIQDVNSNLLNEGVIAQVKTPLNNILSQNINSGGSFAGFQEQLRTFIKGNGDIEGRLLRYTSTYTSDTLFNYSRGWQEAVTADLGLEFYLYSGGIIAKGKKSAGSREFCIERVNKYYHRKEIEAWASLKWAGKNPLTTKSSIFTFAGGYSCRHSIIPVSELILPDEVIQRAISEGFYKKKPPT
jgi:hypothetical protein